MNYRHASELRRELEARGEARVRARGEARGEARGRAAALLDVMEVRCADLTEEQRARIENCEDLALLRTWTVRAVDGRSAAEVLDGPAQD